MGKGSIDYMLTDFLAQSETIQNITTHATEDSTQLLLGVHGSARAASIAALYQAQPRQMLVVTDTQVHADQLLADLSQLTTAAMGFPAEESLATEIAISSPELRMQRVATLLALRRQEKVIVVTSLAGVERLLPKPETLDKASLNLAVG